MKIRSARLDVLVLSFILMFGAGCAVQETVDTTPKLGSKLVTIPVVATSEIQKAVQKGASIVITDIEGECQEEVQDALMQRLIDNADYDVLTRRYLRQILIENTQGSSRGRSGSWEGDFNDDTGAKIGNLLRASQHIVGRVVYCGPTFSTEDTGNPSRTQGRTIIALLQILDLESGRVILSTAAEGNYTPRFTAMLKSETFDPRKLERLVDSEQPRTKLQDEEGAEPGAPEEETKVAERKSFRERIGLGRSKVRTEIQQKFENYPTLRAAEDLADSFAQKFFSRPKWEKVEMWDNPHWHYGASIRYVKLGRCPAAVTLLENIGADELSFMPDLEVGEYLHNFGVALLCANRPEEALKKLRAAYRLNYEASTLAMISFGSKILEWRLQIEVDTEPEMQLLMERIGSSGAEAYRAAEAETVSP